MVDIGLLIFIMSALTLLLLFICSILNKHYEENIKDIRKYSLDMVKFYNHVYEELYKKCKSQEELDVVLDKIKPYERSVYNITHIAHYDGIGLITNLKKLSFLSRDSKYKRELDTTQEKLSYLLN